MNFIELCHGLVKVKLDKIEENTIGGRNRLKSVCSDAEATSLEFLLPPQTDCDPIK